MDGCSKAYAKRATEKYCDKVSAAIDVTELIGKEVAEAGALSARNLTDEHKEMVEKVVSEITSKFDEVWGTAQKDLATNPFAMIDSGPSGGCGL
ncbi:MAG: hypothetical protein WA125_04965 [Desulfosporosinus sp.]